MMILEFDYVILPQTDTSLRFMYKISHPFFNSIWVEGNVGYMYMLSHKLEPTKDLKQILTEFALGTWDEWLQERHQNQELAMDSMDRFRVNEVKLFECRILRLWEKE